MMKIWILAVIAVITVESCRRTNCSRTRVAAPGRYNFSSVPTKYATYDEIMDWYQRLAKRYRSLITLFDIGNSYEGRKQMVLRFSNRPKDDRPSIFIEATQHAREWLAPATLNNLIYRFILSYQSRKSEAVNALGKYIFYFMSVTNPDGYVFSFDTSNPKNRYWRKNRRPGINGCYGVDLNRNWDIGFGGPGGSTKHCEETYQGTHPFSEPETRNVKEFVMNRIGRGNITLYISLHSYSQMWVVPWSYQNRTPWNYDELARAAKNASDTAKAVDGKTYSVGHGAAVFGVTAGGSDDWFLSKMGANYSYTLECRPSQDRVLNNWKFGFSPGSSEICPSGKEVYVSLMALVKTMNHTRDG